MATTTSCSWGITSTTITSRSSGSKRSRRSPKQASEARLEAKKFKDEYDARYKAAFKDATNLAAVNAAGGEKVNSNCRRLNQDFQLHEKNGWQGAPCIKP
jgi:hypothetical protein